MASEIEKEVRVDTPYEQPAMEEAVEYFVDPKEEKRVLRKIDLYVLPALVVVFFFQCQCKLPRNLPYN